MRTPASEPMLRLPAVLLVLLSAASVQGQEAPDLGPQGSAVPGLVLGGVALGAAAGAATWYVVADVSGEAVPTFLAAEAAYALGVGAGVALVGAAAGVEGSPVGALRAGAVGATVGVGSMGVLLLATQGGGLSAIPVVLLGGLVSAVAPTVIAVRGYDARPAVLRGPEGAAALGLRVRLSL